MNIKKTEFGITKDGEKASRYLMENASGIEVELSDFGAQFLAIRVPDKVGVKRDVLFPFLSRTTIFTV